MRQIFLDTETTGLEANSGDRVIELGCVEMVNRELTGNNLHLYFNPGRDSNPDALAVHGLTTEFLSQYPPFEEQVGQIANYLEGAELCIHNAPFDMGFLDMEFGLTGRAPLSDSVTVKDTLTLAKQKYPGKRNNLDALCDRLGISNEHRTLHGALLDAELLAQVYLAMTRGQFGLLDAESSQGGSAQTAFVGSQINAADLPVIRANADELAAHSAYLEGLDAESDGQCLWNKLLAEEPAAQQQ